jgi:hypothetical protein
MERAGLKNSSLCNKTADKRRRIKFNQCILSGNPKSAAPVIKCGSGSTRLEFRQKYFYFILPDKSSVKNYEKTDDLNDPPPNSYSIYSHFNTPLFYQNIFAIPEAINQMPQKSAATAAADLTALNLPA